MNKTLATLAGLTALAATANAVTYPTIQAPASDANSSYFQANVLPGFLGLFPAEGVGKNAALPQYNSFAQNLNIGSDSLAARVYFVGESAGYKNTLRYTDDGSGIPPGQGVIFDFSAPPLTAGNYADLGVISGGSVLDFFVLANGVNGGTQVYSTVTGANSFPDAGLDHVLQLATYSGPNSTFYLYAFEDMPVANVKGRGDRDYNDVIFAVELTRTPEPATLAVLGSFLGIAYVIKRRKNA